MRMFLSTEFQRSSLSTLGAFRRTMTTSFGSVCFIHPVLLSLPHEVVPPGKLSGRPVRPKMSSIFFPHLCPFRTSTGFSSRTHHTRHTKILFFIPPSRPPQHNLHLWATLWPNHNLSFTTSKFWCWFFFTPIHKQLQKYNYIIWITCEESVAYRWDQGRDSGGHDFNGTRRSLFSLIFLLCLRRGATG